jgi:hypothetical protein
MRRLPLIFLAAIGLTAVAAPAASAATRYAAPDGASDGQCLTEETACDINRAVEQPFGWPAPATTEVVILPGAYDLGTTENLYVPPGVDVHGKAGAEIPVITNSATSATVINVFNGNSRLADVKVVKAGGSGGAFTLGDTTSVVERVQASTAVTGSVACSHIRGTIRDTSCLAQATNGLAIGQNQAGAGTYSGTLRNVTAVARGTNSRALSYTANNQAGISLSFDAKNVIADGEALDVRVGSTVAGSSSTLTLQNSNYSSVDGGGTVPGTVTPAGTNGNQTEAPAFVDVAGGDLHQAPGSPTIDAGIADANNGTQDFDRAARTQGAGIDIGADEYFVAPPVQTPGQTGGPGTISPQQTQPAGAAKKCKRKRGKGGRKRCKPKKR